MNKRYEEGRKPLFSEPGKNERKQYVWAKDKDGKEYLQETESIDVQAEIESYADECDIKNIVKKASFDPAFMASLSQGALSKEEMPITDITGWPQNVHEYHQMMATAQVNAMKLEELKKAQETAQEKVQKEETNEQK